MMTIPRNSCTSRVTLQAFEIQGGGFPCHVIAEGGKLELV